MKCKGAEQSKSMRRDLQERFWQKVNKTDSCWLWTGARLRTGYGSIRIKKKSERAHRIAYQIAVGDIPEGCLILHSCDNKICVNPSHLKVGDHRDNTLEAIERGLHPVGERSKKAKLSNLDVSLIRAGLREGILGSILAKRFGVCEATISLIKRNKTRIHINSK